MNNCFKELDQSNYWNRRISDSGTPRNSYTNRILSYIGNKLIKILVGQRCTGKSYLLRQIAARLVEEGVSSRNILYINRAFTDSGVFTTYRELEEILETYRTKIHPVGKVYIFVEEIQNVEGWENFVHVHSQDWVDSCELFISGSNLEMLSGNAESLLAGHYVSFEIFPFSYIEYIGFEKEEVGRHSYLQYMDRGALPQLYVPSDDEYKRNYVSSIKDTVLLRDIIQRYRIKDSRVLEDVFIYLASHTSELVSITNLVHFFKEKERKTSYDTIANYIAYLENSFLLHRVERYQIKSKESILGNCRYYLNDLAFKIYLYPFFNHSQKSRLENLILLDLKRADYKIAVGAIRNSLVDFVARKGDRIIYIQITPLMGDEQTAASVYAPLEMIPDNYEKLVVSLDEQTWPSKDGIRHIQAWRLYEIL